MFLISSYTSPRFILIATSLLMSIGTAEAARIYPDGSVMIGQLAVDRYAPNTVEMVRSNSNGTTASFYGRASDGRFFSCYYSKSDSAQIFRMMEKAANNSTNGSFFYIRKSPTSNKCEWVRNAKFSVAIRPISQSRSAIQTVVSEPIQPSPISPGSIEVLPIEATP